MATETPPKPMPSEQLESFDGSIPSDAVVDSRLSQTRRQLRSVDLAAGLLWLACATIAWFLFFAILDHWVFDNGIGTLGRWTMLLVFLGGSAAFSFFYIFRPLIHRVNPIYIAHRIEQQDASAKNSLINFLLLRRSKESVAPSVYNAVKERAAGDIQKVAPDEAIDWNHVLRIAYLFTALFAIGAIYQLVSPKSPFASVARAMAPWSERAVPTRVTFSDIKPGNLTTFYGQRIVISGEVSGLHDNEVPTLYYTTADNQLVDQAVPMSRPEGDYHYACTIPPDPQGIQQDISYYLKAGDGQSPTFIIKAEAPPAIAVESIRYDYPDYTREEPKTVTDTADILALEGTRITLHTKANCTIDRAEIDLGCDNLHSIPMAVDNRTATGSWTLRLEEDPTQAAKQNSYQIRFVDTAGNENPSPIRHSIRIIPDRIPTVWLVDPPSDAIELPENGRLELNIEAEDPDFGLRSVLFHAEQKGHGLTVPPMLRVAMGEPSPPKTYSGTFVFEPERLNLKAGDEVEYWVEAQDIKTPIANTGQTVRRLILIVPKKEDGEQATEDKKQEEKNQNQDQPQENPDQQNQQNQQQQDQGGEQNQGKNNQQQQQNQGSEEAKGQQDQNGGGNQEQAGDNNQKQQNQGSEEGKGQQDQPGAGNQEQPGNNQQQQQNQGSEEGNGQQNQNDNQSGQPDGSQSKQPQQGDTFSDPFQSKNTPQSQGTPQNGHPKDPGKASDETPDQPIDGETNPGDVIEKVLKQCEKQDSGELKEGMNQEGKKGSEENQNPEGQPDSQNQKNQQDQVHGKSQEDGPKVDEFGDPIEEPVQGDQKGEEERKGTGTGDEQTTKPDGGEPDTGKGDTLKPTGDRDEKGKGTFDNQLDKPNGREEEIDHGQKGEELGSPDDKKGKGEKTDQTNDGPGTPDDKKGDAHGEEFHDPFKDDPTKDHKKNEQKSPYDLEKTKGECEGGDCRKEAGDKDKPGKSDGGESDQSGDDLRNAKQPGDLDNATPQDLKGKGTPVSPDGLPKDQQPSPTGDASQQDQPNGTFSGGTGKNSEGPDLSEIEQIGPDPFDKEAADRKTALALEYLKDQLAQEKPDPELLQSLGGWTRDDIKQFVNRWESMRDAAKRANGVNDKAARQYEEALRSLGLPTGHAELKARSESQHVDDVRQSRRTQPPKSWRDRINAYQRSIGAK